MNNINNITVEDRNNFQRSTFYLYIDDNAKDKIESTMFGVFDDYIPHLISSIELLVHKIVNSEVNIFYIERNKNSKGIACKDKPILKEMKRYMNYAGCFLFKEIVSVFPFHRFNPYFEVFIRNLENSINRMLDLDTVYFAQFDQYPDETDKKLQAMVDALNDFIERIRSDVLSQQFKAEINYCLALINDNHLNVMNCIDDLFTQQSQLLVLRMEIGYRRKYDCFYKIDSDYYDVEDEINNFFAATKNKPVFKHLLGYVWKADFSKQKELNYHLFFFFDGSKVQDDLNLSKKIGEYWAYETLEYHEIMPDRIYYSYNRNINQYKEKHHDTGVIDKPHDIGMIHKDDTESRKELEKTIRYITMRDYFARMSAPHIRKTFGITNIKPNQTTMDKLQDNTTASTVIVE